MADWTVDYFGKELLTKDGAKPTKEALAGKTRIAIYFSAHWVSTLCIQFPSISCVACVVYLWFNFDHTFNFDVKTDALS